MRSRYESPNKPVAATIFAFAMLIVSLFYNGALTANAVAAPVPPDLVKLEKLVGLELAHVRDAGPVDPAKRKMLFDARSLDQQAEDSIKAGDYKSAEENLLKARVLLRQLND